MARCGFGSGSFCPSFTEQFSDVRTRTDDSRAAYLQKQLTLFQSGRRGGSAYQHLMTGFAKKLAKNDISALSAYFSIR
jgi:cytochrome c553